MLRDVFPAARNVRAKIFSCFFCSSMPLVFYLSSTIELLLRHAPGCHAAVYAELPRARERFRAAACRHAESDIIDTTVFC